MTDQTQDPRYLNLDDLETESDIKIKHDGVDHTMVTLTVEKFIQQQKRASTLEAESQKAAAEGKNVRDEDMAEVVTLLRNSIADYFPTLPVDELPVAKLFVIFGWLNEISAKINDESQLPTEDEVSEGEDGEAEGDAGNVNGEDGSKA